MKLPKYIINFTKDKWTFSKLRGKKRTFSINSSNWDTMMKCYYPKGYKKEGLANAMLVSQAPKLFATLVIIAHQTNDYLIRNAVSEIIESVIGRKIAYDSDEWAVLVNECCIIRDIYNGF